MAQAHTSSLSTEPTRKEKLFYIATDLHYSHRLFRIFRAYVTSEQYFHSIIPGMPIPEGKKDFFLERCHRPTIDKWMLFFKYLLKYHTLIDVEQMLCEGFNNAGLTL